MNNYRVLSSNRLVSDDRFLSICNALREAMVPPQMYSACIGLTAEYPSTPKEILKSVATRLRRHAEYWQSSEEYTIE